MNMWNTHRIRPQKDTFLPNGVPDHTVYTTFQFSTILKHVVSRMNLSKKHNLLNLLVQCTFLTNPGLEVTGEDLKDAATQSGVLECQKIS